jgi:hypothetical protein
LQDVLLEVQGQKVSGYTQADVIGWLNHCSRNGNPVVLKTVPQGRQNVNFLKTFCPSLKMAVNGHQHYITGIQYVSDILYQPNLKFDW